MCYKLKNNQGTSGFTWSEEDGANIGFEDEAVWEVCGGQVPLYMSIFEYV